jgi:hypothetical protein
MGELAIVGNTGGGPELPALIAGAGKRAAWRFVEFLTVNMRVVCSLCFLAVASTTAYCGTITITNSPPWDGNLIGGDSEPMWGFGSSSDVPTFGQVFTVPTGASVLQQFSVTLILFPQPLTFTAEVEAWDSAGFHPVGAALLSETTSAAA